MSPAQAADALKRTEQQILDWESGESEPTFAQLEKIAKVYGRPIGVFYLPEPPRDFDVVRDFRRLPGQSPGDFSPALTLLLRKIQERGLWLSETIRDRGHGKSEAVGFASVGDGAESVGQMLRARLGVTIDDQRSQTSFDAAFRFWRERCERLGICVFQPKDADVQEMRGIALSDEYAPIIVVNGKDAYAGKIFTLLHEMAHIAIGSSGVSDLNVSASPRGIDESLEVFCNATASEALVPAADFRVRFKAEQHTPDTAIEPMSKFYRVSREVIARRLLDLGLATRQFYEVKRAEFQNEIRPVVKKTGKKIIIPQTTIVLSACGKRFSNIAVSAFQSGEIMGARLAQLLDMRLQHLSKLERILSPSRIQAKKIAGQ